MNDFGKTPARNLRLEKVGAGSSTHVADPAIPMTLALKVTGSARVEYSTDDALTWKPWTAGTVTEDTEAVLSNPVAAIRLTVVSGSATLDLVW